MKMNRTLAEDLQSFININSNTKSKNNARLNSCLEILCSQKASLKIIPIGRTKCLICHQYIKSGESRLKFPCSCFYDMHYDCFNEKPLKYFRLTSSGNYLKCKNCKAKYHISGEYQDIAQNFQQKINVSKITHKNQFEEEKAETFECKICSENKLVCITLECKHKFCQSCLQKHITYHLEQNKYSLKTLICPEENCKKPLTFKLIQKIFKKKEFDNIDRKILSFNAESFISKNEKIAKCPKATCDFFFIMKKNDNSLKKYSCPICKEEFCVNGCPETHKGLTCQQYQNLIKKEGNEFYNIVKKNHIKTCEKCGAWIEKNKGCNHITCKCTYQFCYICGVQWKNCNCGLYDKVDDSEISENSDVTILHSSGTSSNDSERSIINLRSMINLRQTRGSLISNRPHQRRDTPIPGIRLNTEVSPESD